MQLQSCVDKFDRMLCFVCQMQDIDSMPQNPVENMPEALRRKNVNARKFGDPKFVVPDNDWRAELPPRVSSSQSLEYASGPSSTATSHPTNTLLKQAKVIFYFHLTMCSISFLLKLKA